MKKADAYALHWHITDPHMKDGRGGFIRRRIAWKRMMEHLTRLAHHQRRTGLADPKW